MVLVSQTPEKSGASKVAKALSAAQLVQEELDKNPDVRLVLEIATRARETEAKEPPRELGASTEVVAIPTNPQCAV